MDKLEELEKEEKIEEIEKEEKINLVLFKINELEKCLEIVKVKCLEPIMDSSSNLEENRDLFNYYLFIKESFKTLDKLQTLIIKYKF
jgi:hypothetical protein